MRKAKLYQLLAVVGGLSVAVASTPALAKDLTSNPLNWAAGSATVDGDIADWGDLSSAPFNRMCEAGRLTTTGECDGKDQLSTLYSRYDCDTDTMYLLVLKEEGHTADDQRWVKIYDLANSEHDVEMADVVVDGVSQGYEASFALAGGTTYTQVEVHINIDGGKTSSTGKKNTDISIDVPVSCEMPVVDEPAPVVDDTPVVYDFTSPQSGSDPSPFSGNGSKCQVGGQTVDVKGMLLGTTSTVNYDTGTVTAEVVNNSGAPQTVTLVTYKEYYGHTNYADVKDSNGNIVKRGQTVHDFETKTVPVGVSQFTVDMPGCSTQIDFVCGEVINYLGDELYGNRKLDWYHAHEGNGNVWCEEPPVVDETPVDETPVDETPVDETPVDSSGGGILGNGDENTSCDDINGSNGVPMSLIAKYETNGSGEYVFEKGTDIINITDANLSGGTWSVEGGVVKVGAIIVKGGTDTDVDQDGNDSFSNDGLVNGGGNTPDISNIQFCEVPVFDASEQVCLWSANKDADGNYTNIVQEGCTDAEQGKFYAIEAGGEFSSALEAE